MTARANGLPGIVWTMKSGMASAPSTVIVGKCSVIGEAGWPSAGELARDPFGGIAELLEVTVFKCNEGAAFVRREGQLDFRHEVGIVGKGAVELPAQERRRVGGSQASTLPHCVSTPSSSRSTHLPPGTGSSVTATAGFFPIVLPPGHQLLMRVANNSKGPRRRGLDLDGMLDRRDAHSVLSFSVCWSAKSLKASSADAQNPSSQSRKTAMPRGSSR